MAIGLSGALECPRLDGPGPEEGLDGRGLGLSLALNIHDSTGPGPRRASTGVGLASTATGLPGDSLGPGSRSASLGRLAERYSDWVAICYPVSFADSAGYTHPGRTTPAANAQNIIKIILLLPGEQWLVGNAARSKARRN